MSEAPALDTRASELRRAFDASFVRSIQSAASDVEDLLLIALSGDRYAIRLREVNSIAQSPLIVSVPSQVPGLLGIAGIRGNIVPVFRLASLLGYNPNAEALGWVIVCGTDDAVAFAFDGFDGFVRAERAALRASEQKDRRYLDEFFADASGARPVVALAQLIAALRHKHENRREKEEA